MGIDIAMRNMTENSSIFVIFYDRNTRLTHEFILRGVSTTKGIPSDSKRRGPNT